MPSAAFSKWKTVGLARLDDLEAVHARATGTGTGPGRRRGTEQLNRSLFVMLVAQFQRYCRDLHDEGVGVHAAQTNPRQMPLLKFFMTQRRKLDTQTPRVSTLVSDFQRLGMKAFLDDLVTGGPAGMEQALEALDTVVNFRNAIVHGNDDEIAALVARGRIRATKESYRYYRRRIEVLAGTMDRVVAARLVGVLGIPPPW